MSKKIVNKVKAQLSEPLEQTLDGEEIVIAKRDQHPAKKRAMGFAKFSVEADFDERIMARMEFEWRE